mgnify:CR=1 FL=1
MTNIVNYLLESGAALAVFYLIYRLFIANRTPFAWQRLFLVGGMFFSALLPLLHISLSPDSPLAAFPQLMLDPVVVSAGNADEAATGFFTRVFSADAGLVPSLFYYIYWAGVLAVASLLFHRIFKIIQMRRVGRTHHHGGYQLIALDRDTPTFSFFNQIFIRKEEMRDPETRYYILSHELVHVRRLHSLDNLFTEILSALQWFNPIIWLLRRELKQVHEYEADRAALDRAGNVHQYTTLLFRQTFGIPHISPVNHFHSSIKKRLLMLRKSKSITDPTRALIFIPLVVALILVFACSENTNKNEQPQKQETVASKKAGAAPQQKDKESKGQNDTDDVFIAVEEMPEFQGEGVAGFRRYIQQQVAYPEEAAEKGLEGTSFIKFIVNREGAVEDIEVVRSSHGILDQAAIDAIKGSPKWKPGTQEGNKVKVQFTMPVVFKLPEKQK